MKITIKSKLKRSKLANYKITIEIMTIKILIILQYCFVLMNYVILFILWSNGTTRLISIYVSKFEAVNILRL